MANETPKPKIKLGPLHREEPNTREATPEEIQREKRTSEIKERGGAYSDRIKIEPKFNAPPRKAPLPSPAEIQRALVAPTLTAQAGAEEVKGSMKDGGTVKETGLYKLHTGEKVVPKEQAMTAEKKAKKDTPGRVKEVLGGKSSKKKSKKKKLKSMRVSHADNGGYIAQHEPAPEEGASAGAAAPQQEQHIIPDMDALKAHMEDHMSQPGQGDGGGDGGGQPAPSPPPS